MIVLKVVVHLWLMEITSGPKGAAAEDAFAFSWDTSSIEAKIVDVILLALSCKFSLPLSSIAFSGISLNRGVSHLITQVWSIVLDPRFL